MKDTIIKNGFIVAGLANIIGILAITRGMTSDTLADADPVLFSSFGVLMIILWGLAYIGTSRVATTAVLLPATFALEKLAYTLAWIFWTIDHGETVPAIMDRDFLGGVFLGGYGINDGLFFLFFAAVAIINFRRK
jgi:hypothetical protein